MLVNVVEYFENTHNQVFMFETSYLAIDYTFLINMWKIYRFDGPRGNPLIDSIRELKNVFILEKPSKRAIIVLGTVR
jgi:hypothetical protein